MELKTVLITQARSGSTRLPGKVLKMINGKTLLEIHLERLQKAKLVNKIVVATTINKEDAAIANISEKCGFSFYKGSENDVLDRYYQAVKDIQPQWVVRVTSDCPLIDPALVDEVIHFAKENNVDYVSNGLIEHYPDGQDVEVFKFSALKTAWENAKLNSEREHVTPYIRSNSDAKGGTLFQALNYPCPADYSMIRMTVDEQRDFELIEKLIGDIGINKTWQEYTDYIINNGLLKINESIVRNEGYLKSLKKD